jgi:hypothetical protein
MVHVPPADEGQLTEKHVWDILESKGTRHPAVRQVLIDAWETTFTIRLSELKAAGYLDVRKK